jgi:hypothetical protein
MAKHVAVITIGTTTKRIGSARTSGRYAVVAYANHDEPNRWPIQKSAVKPKTIRSSGLSSGFS